MSNPTPAIELKTTEDLPDHYTDGNYWLSQDGNTLFVVIPGIGDMCPLPLNDCSEFATEVKGRWTFNPDTITLTPSIHRTRHRTTGGVQTRWHGWLRNGAFHKI